ncbi:MAG: PIG-L family deacetylase [Bdellovibrionales bacterium]|nr:PIG-L family deacetylase [Bdellovibrionales bacterium]
MSGETGLIVVAHPDDETLFFSGLVMSEPHRSWKLICVTDGNADGQGLERMEQLEKTSQSLGFSQFRCLQLPDLFESRLNLEKLQKELDQETSDIVYTHGVIGEYGHPHHQDVSLVTHRAFYGRCPIYSVAYNCFPEKVVSLDRSSWKIKSKLISRTYYDETKRFIEFVPASAIEAFVQVALSEVELIYENLTEHKILVDGQLSVYEWYLPYLNDFHRKSRERPF